MTRPALRPFACAPFWRRACLALVAGLIVAAAVLPASADAVLNKLGNLGNLRRMKTTTVTDGRVFTMMLFDNKLVAIDQNGAESGSYVIRNCRALATDGDMVFVMGMRTDVFELIKLRYLPAERKFTVVGTPQPRPTAISNDQINASVDMCFTRLGADGAEDPKVWMIASYGQIYEMCRWSAGPRDGSAKLDTIPPTADGTTTVNYVRAAGSLTPQSHSYYHLRSDTSVFAISSAGPNYPVRMEPDPDGKSFWLAASDTNKSMRVGQIRRTGVYGIESPKIQNPTWGGLPIYQASTGTGLTNVQGLAVDADAVYVYSFASAGVARVFRIPRSGFGSGVVSTTTTDTSGLKYAEIRNPSGADAASVVAGDMVVYNGRVTVCGRLESPANAALFLAAGQSTGTTLPGVGRSNIFVATLLPDFSAWESAVCLPEAYETIDQPRFAHQQIFLTQANADCSNLVLGARFLDAGNALFENVYYGGNGNSFSLLLSSRDNRPAAERFILRVTADGKPPGRTDVSPLELSKAGFTPGFGVLSAGAGEALTVTAPEAIYVKQDGTFLNLSGKSKAEIEAAVAAPDVVARYRPSGYTLTRQGDQQTELGQGNAVTVVLTKNTNLTFHFQRDFALTVGSRLDGLGLDPVAGQTLGSPEPAAGKHWIAENDLVEAKVNGVVSSLTDVGTRYLATGYTATGLSDRQSVTFGESLAEHAVQGFTMGGPVRLTYTWKVQHSITAGTSATKAAALPGIKHPGGVATGSGVFWFDHGTEVTVGAADSEALKLQMAGVFTASAALGSFDGLRRGAFTDTFTADGRSYRGRKITLNSAGSIAWDYGDPVYHQVVPLGTPVAIAPGRDAFAPGDMLTASLAATVNLNVRPKVTALNDAPPGTTADNAIVWSAAERRAWPVRPGTYTLEWTRNDGSGLLTQIVVGFPGDPVSHPALPAGNARFFAGAKRHLRALLHPDLAPVELDPDTTDDVAFSQLAFSATLAPAVSASALVAPRVLPAVDPASATMTFASVAGGSLSDAVGRHVLVFSRSLNGAAATGDLNQEGAVVRVLETRPWNDATKWDAAPRANRVLSLNGSSSFARTALKNLAGNELTIQYWFKGTSARSAVRQQRGGDYILAPWSGRAFGTSVMPDPLGAGAVTAPTTLENGRWHLVTMTWQRNSANGLGVYLDSVGLVGRSTPDVPLPQIDAEVVFGAFLDAANGATSEFASGRMDEISIWNRALPVAEIIEHYKARQLTGTEPGLVGYWNFDAGDGRDVTGHGFDATLAGGALVVEDTDAELIPAPAPDLTGDKMIASADAPLAATIGERLTDPLDLAAIRTGFVTGRLAHYNVDFHARGTSPATAGPIFPVNLNYHTDEDHSLTVIWYEKKDGVLWPWRPRRYRAEWPATSRSRVVIASQLGSDGLSLSYQPQRKFDTASTGDLRVYVQNDPLLPGYNPNEEHALVGDSVKYAGDQPTPRAVFALRRDLNFESADANHTSRPVVLAEYTDLATNQPAMALYRVESRDTAILPFNGAQNLATLTSLSLTGAEVRLSLPFGLYAEEALGIQVVAGSLPGVSSGQTVYAHMPAGNISSSAPGLSLTPGGPPITVTNGAISGTVIKISRRHPYVFQYQATAGLPVPLPHPLESVTGAVPPAESSGGEEGDYTAASSAPARVYYEDYKGNAWVVSGNGALFHTKPWYRMQDTFWHKLKPDGAKAGATDAGTQSAAGTPIEWLPAATNPDTGGKVLYTAQWPTDLPVLKVGETLSFPGGEYKQDHPSAPGLPGVVGWAAGRVVFDSATPAMDRAPSSSLSSSGATALNDLTFDTYGARLIAPLATRSVTLASLGLSADAIAHFRSKIQPSTGVTALDGAVWRFQKLPASLRNRVHFDPLANALGLQGFLNDKTLGDSTLTQTPPPAYLLEPNVLREDDRQKLIQFKADEAESSTLTSLIGPEWDLAVNALHALSRNPDRLHKRSDPAADRAAWYTGLAWAPQRDSQGGVLTYTATGALPKGAVASQVPGGMPAVPNQPVPTSQRATPASLLGPGLALVGNPALLASSASDADQYVTLAENDDASLGLPVTLHVIKISKKHRFRGAIKLIEGDNAFSEKVTLRHTADFGANTDDVEFQWYCRPDDGRTVPTPWTGSQLGSWQQFPDARGMQIDLDANGRWVLPDLWFFARYRHKSDTGNGTASWTGTSWAEHGKPEPGTTVGELWAGAANSPQPDGTYLPQLIPGWLKRVLDRINPYEARFSDFHNSGAPATYASMLQQAGTAYNGPVALNPDKDVVENTGLIALYQTLLERAKKLGLSEAITDAALRNGVMNAIQLAATRVQDLYMVVGNEAYADGQDPLVGFGSSSAEYGTSAASIWTFMNQTASPLEEELAMLRGGSFSFGRPVHNRLFWNFTKDLGEVAYAQTYNLSDENGDGFIDEKDAMLRYPMGHGDAWGHYTTALKLHYDLLASPNFVWQPRGEFYNLLDTAIPVDFYDERKFAAAAAARTRTGADIVSLTYRQRYTDDPDGQWQGYTDTDTDRAWGVEGWARRAGQGALLDWAVANSLLPATAPNSGAAKVIQSATSQGNGSSYELGLSSPIPVDRSASAPKWLLVATLPDGTSQEIVFEPTSGFQQSTTLRVSASPNGSGYPSVTVLFPADAPVAGLAAANFSLAIDLRPQGVQRVDRTTVDALEAITREYTRIESAVLDANGGLNPLGLAKDAVPFDIDPAAYSGRDGSAPVSHFEQIYERARRAVANARTIFDGSTAALNATRQNQDSLEAFAGDVADHDAELRNRLIEIFGTPHEGNIGTGKPYPDGYLGPDLYFHPYVDVSEVSAETVPHASESDDIFLKTIGGFKQQMLLTDGTKWTDALDFEHEDLEANFVPAIQKLFLNDYGDFNGSNAKIREMRSVSIVDDSPVQLKLPIRASGYAFTAPASWGVRARTGELQTLISDLVQAETDLALALADYRQYVAEIDAAALTLTAQHASALANMDTLRDERVIVSALAATRAALETTSAIAQGIHDRGQDALDLVGEITPTTLITGFSFGGDILRPARSVVLTPLKGAIMTAGGVVTAANAAIPALNIYPELANYNVAISDVEHGVKYEIQAQLIALKLMMQQEPTKRLAILQAQEAMRQASDAYRTALNAGIALVGERADFNRSAAGDVQQHRYQDMTFRLFRNEALDKYHAAFDLAARYTWLAAKAYEYETNLPANHPGSARSVLEDIVRARLVGDLQEGEPVLGDGLAGALATLRDNYGVLRGQLGLNNAQSEDSRISLRGELFRLKSASDDAFRAELANYRRPDLNQVPEFRRFCRPFAAAGTAQPGLVIPMPTTITAGKNVFARDLGPGDHSFDPSLFATKVSGVGVWFEGYDLTRFASAPRVYLIPAGNDWMLEPASTSFVPRGWTIVDQRIPVPHALGSSPLGPDGWNLVTDTLDGLPGEIRKFSSFRAFAGGSGAAVDPSQMTFDSRLVGRSVWNDRWLLVIPGQTLGANAATSLDAFLGPNGVKDIHLVFKTFGFSGN